MTRRQNRPPSRRADPTPVHPSPPTLRSFTFSIDDESGGGRNSPAGPALIQGPIGEPQQNMRCRAGSRSAFRDYRAWGDEPGSTTSENRTVSGPRGRSSLIRGNEVLRGSRLESRSGDRNGFDLRCRRATSAPTTSSPAPRCTSSARSASRSSTPSSPPARSRTARRRTGASAPRRST